MSFSKYFQVEHLEGGAVTLPDDASVISPATLEHQAIMDCALDKLHDLVHVVSRPGDKVNVNVTGHANSDLAPTPGWSNSTLNISLSQVPAESE